MKEVNKLKQELLIMKTENIKPNYSELARLHECDRRTIKKYNEGYEGKPVKRNKESRLDKYKEEIKTKLKLPGSTIKGTYEYFKNKEQTKTTSFLSCLFLHINHIIESLKSRINTNFIIFRIKTHI